jgi:hypothetical protein
MERLPHDPRNLRKIVVADLRRASRLVIKVQDEIDAPDPASLRHVTTRPDPTGRLGQLARRLPDHAFLAKGNSSARGAVVDFINQVEN